MGTLVSNPTAVAAFDGQIFKKGLDLNRSIIGKDLGTEVVNPTATIRPGMMVSRDASGYIVPATGLAGAYVYGIAKWGKDAYGVSVAVDVPMVVTAFGVAYPLIANGAGRSGCTNVTVRSAPNMGGTLYVGGGTAYTITAGTTITFVGAPLVVGQTVYVSFTYNLTDADYNTDGRFWQNQDVDRTAYQEGRITVITDWSRVFTVEWASGTGIATGLTYDLTTAASNLYCDANSRFNNSISGQMVGRVYQLPTASDPYMGVTAHGNPGL